MIDANEAWGAKEAATKLGAIRDAGHEILWVEDPILRHVALEHGSETLVQDDLTVHP